jgi:uncharacterized membrane protein YhfC
MQFAKTKHKFIDQLSNWNMKGVVAGRKDAVEIEISIKLK